jgi:hypothetical protein
VTAPTIGRSQQPVVRRILAVFAATMLIACASDSKKLTQHVDKSASWLATVDVTTDAWIHNSVPARFAERTLEEAHAHLAKAVQSVKGLDVNAADRARTLAALQLATESASEMADAVRRRDRRSAAVRRAMLSLEEQSLDSLVDELKRRQGEQR